MGKSSWNKKLTMILFGKFYFDMLPEGRRALTNIHSYIKDLTFNDSN